MSLKGIVMLNPDYHFRNDLDRVVMYSGNEVASYSSAKWIGFIHPIQALILSLFTNPRPLVKQMELLSTKFHISMDKAERIIAPYINNEQPIYTEFASNTLPFPKNVLIDAEKINLDSVHYDIDANALRCDSIDLTQDRMHKGPQSMLFMLTSKCATACKYCYADRKTKYHELNTERILQIIEEARTLKMTHVDVIGGEVFCKKNWNLILQALVQAKLMPNFLSTKVPITENIAQLLYQTGYNNVVQISLDSLNEEVLSKTIGIKSGYLKKVKEGIDYLQQYGFKIQIDSVLTKYNVSKEEIQNLYNYVKSIHDLACWEVRVPGVSIYNRQTFSEVKADKMALQEICMYVRTNILPIAQIKIRVNDDELINTFREGKCTDIGFREGRCSVLNQSLFILPDGKVSLCEQLYWHPQFIIGDLCNQSIEEVWHSEKAKSMFVWKKSFYQNTEGQCIQCKVFDFCHDSHRKCWYRVLRAYGEEKWDYPDPRCEFAPKMKVDATY